MRYFLYDVQRLGGLCHAYLVDGAATINGHPETGVAAILVHTAKNYNITCTEDCTVVLVTEEVV
jgi:hypothetical protein